MNSMIKIIQKDFSYAKVLTNILLNTTFTIILYLIFYKGYATSFFNHKTLTGNMFIFPNIISFLMISYAFMKGFFEYDKLVNDDSYIINLKTANIFENCIYWGKTFSIWFHLIISILINSIILLIFSGISINGLWFFNFLIFMMISSLLIILIAGFIRFFTKSNKFLEYNILFGFIFLLICSGFVFPFYLITGSIFYFFKFLPFAIIMEGGSKCINNHIFSLIEILYISISTITLLIINYILYKKELTK